MLECRRDLYFQRRCWGHACIMPLGRIFLIDAGHSVARSQWRSNPLRTRWALQFWRAAEQGGLAGAGRCGGASHAYIPAPVVTLFLVCRVSYVGGKLGGHREGAEGRAWYGGVIGWVWVWGRDPPCEQCGWPLSWLA